MNVPRLSSPFDSLRQSIVRITISSKDTGVTVGTGVFLAPSLIVTCAHVLLGHRNLSELTSVVGGGEGKLLEKAFHRHFRKKISLVRVQLSDGVTLAVGRIAFDAAMDIGVIRLPTRHARTAVPVAKGPMLGETVACIGFGEVIQNSPERWPLAIHRGVVSSVSPMCIGGYKRRPFLLVDMLALGGLSGSPLLDDQGRFCGLMNGGMTWGNTGYLRYRAERMSPAIVIDDSWIPLSVGFATTAPVVLRIVKRLAATLGALVSPTTKA